MLPITSLRVFIRASHIESSAMGSNKKEPLDISDIGASLSAAATTAVSAGDRAGLVNALKNVNCVNGGRCVLLPSRAPRPEFGSSLPVIVATQSVCSITTSSDSNGDGGISAKIGESRRLISNLDGQQETQLGELESKSGIGMELDSRLYLHTVTETKLLVDTSGGEKLHINRHDIIKKIIDINGKVIEEIKEGIGDPQSDDECCNSCEEVREAYRRKGCGMTNPDLIDQCKREGFPQKIKDKEGEGCNIYGPLEVNKVA
ncbi:hypothetical protein L2E82_37664 [Cichorium intybus]|uniref:Uncharacterized protein n=1 Tax=Cichorium intybus TaxID=13427 RepID=A0ACB9AF47_CICIN|nr:hypothetical protein L2E82_37664 [Cichorium intybus]